MSIEKPTKCDLLNAKSIVEYLSSLGHEPAYIKKGYEYWYHSPISGKDSNPSFKVDTRTNKWIDFSDELKQKTLIDLGIRLTGMSMRDFIQKSDAPLKLKDNIAPDPIKYENINSTNEVLSTRRLYSYPLLNYIKSRGISKEIADTYCKEVTYRNSKGTFYAIGFPNRSGGYELRNPNFKGSTLPKDITHINNGSSVVGVFEGFFSFLSYIKLNPSMDHTKKDYVILNSLSLFERGRSVMEKYDKVKLFLDRDEKGIEKTEYAKKLDSNKYQDYSGFYHGYKDVNKYLMNDPIAPVQNLERKRSIA